MKIKGLKNGFSFAKGATSLTQSQLSEIWKSGIGVRNWMDTLSAMRIPNSRSNVILIQILNKHRKELDARFAEMSLDPDCRKEANLRAREFGGSDGETAKLLEG